MNGQAQCRAEDAYSCGTRLAQFRNNTRSQCTIEHKLHGVTYRSSCAVSGSLALALPPKRGDVAVLEKGP